MTAKRRLEALEARRGVGWKAWAEVARAGARAFLSVAGEDPKRRAEVRRIFAHMRASYRPGMGAADLEAALDSALDGLFACLPHDAVVSGLLHLARLPD
ncbi:MAG: hypothetical protein Q4C89_01450 [Deinococcus sp.]|uniref:hypothetical protein n=1 Tax=Deinococcus sp. TaxID=47478 RepID=UPI0026DD128E|nr:hypothetical protein [Deinococcus sp.]MDO4244674.1 hypothetical protein [Deinococcus sp.]